MDMVVREVRGLRDLRVLLATGIAIVLLSAGPAVALDPSVRQDAAVAARAAGRAAAGAAIGGPAGRIIGGTPVGVVVGGILSATRTVDQRTETRHREEAIRAGSRPGAGARRAQ